MKNTYALVHYFTGDHISVSPKSGNGKFTLAELQEIVGGRIQSSKIDRNTDCIYNEEGRLLQLRQNPHFPHLFGNVIVINKNLY